MEPQLNRQRVRPSLFTGIVIVNLLFILLRLAAILYAYNRDGKIKFQMEGDKKIRLAPNIVLESGETYLVEFKATGKVILFILTL